MKTKKILLVASLVLMVGTVACKKDHEIPTGKVFNSETGGDTIVPGGDTIAPVLPEGGLPYLFSVSSSQQVWFSQGNLQYKASTNTWRFAINQYDFVGEANSNISSTYSDWIDLFGWGTGNEPTKASTVNNDYSMFNDWGNNRISNGGNEENLWRTLAISEWMYVFNIRSTNSGIRYAKAQINDKNGLVLLPDDWDSNYYTLNSVNDGEASFNSNIVSVDDWENSLEPHGAVFLPAAGNRDGTTVNDTGRSGNYWSNSDYGSTYAIYASFGGLHVGEIIESRCNGRSVRLVCNAE